MNVENIQNPVPDFLKKEEKKSISTDTSIKRDFEEATKKREDKKHRKTTRKPKNTKMNKKSQKVKKVTKVLFTSSGEDSEDSDDTNVSILSTNSDSNNIPLSLLKYPKKIILLW